MRSIKFHLNLLLLLVSYFTESMADDGPFFANSKLSEDEIRLRKLRYTVWDDGHREEYIHSTFRVIRLIDCVDSDCTVKRDWLIENVKQRRYTQVNVFANIGENIAFHCPTFTLKTNLNTEGSNFTWYSFNAQREAATYRAGRVSIDHFDYINRSFSEIKNGTNGNYFLSDSGILYIKNVEYHESNSYYCEFSMSSHVPIILFNLFVLDKLRTRPKLITRGDPYLLPPSIRRRLDPVESVNNHTHQKLVVFQLWSDWSPCHSDKCGTHGIRHRVGYCRIDLKEYPLFYASYLEVNRFNVAFYPNGWPCNWTRSFDQFSVEFLSNATIFTDSVEYEACKYECRDNVSMADSSIEFLFSLGEEKNKTTATISDDQLGISRPRRVKLIKKLYDKVRLNCLGFKLPSLLTLEWLKNGYKIKSSTSMRDRLNNLITTRNRTANDEKESIFNDLVFDRVGFKDSGVYECVINGQVVVAIHLIVNNTAFSRNLDQERLSSQCYSQIMPALLFHVFVLLVLVASIVLVDFFNNKETAKPEIKEKKTQNMSSQVQMSMRASLARVEQRYWNVLRETNREIKKRHRQPSIVSKVSYEYELTCCGQQKL